MNQLLTQLRELPEDEARALFDQTNPVHFDPATGCVATVKVPPVREVGQCLDCGDVLYHDDLNPTSPISNVGDYDVICYPCQFKRMDDGTWDEWIERHLR